MSNTFCSTIQHLIANVLCTKVGICAREIELVHVSTGKPPSEKKSNVAVDDRFRLKIPISDQYMTWEVIFNCSLPNCPPDFDLNDIDFFYSVTLESMEELLPSLNNWDHRKDKALINVISELRSAYLKYQVDKLESIDNRCAHEYSSLINEHKVPAENVEVYVDLNTINFLIKLEVDFSLFLPPPVPLPENYFIVLAIKFGALSTARTTSLLTSDNIVELIDGTLEVPRNIKSEENISEYADVVVKSIENQVVTVIEERQEKRKLFIFHLLKELGRSVISYDAMEHTSATFLLQRDRGYFYLLEVTIPIMFPSKPPKYRLISVYPTKWKNRPFSQIINLSFNDSVDIHILVEQAINAIRTKRIKLFQDCSLTAFSLEG